MKPILILTEGYDRSEDRLGKPLTGIYNTLTDWLFIQAGLMRKDLTIKSIFNQEIKRSKDGKTIMDRRGSSLWKYNHGYQEGSNDAKRAFERFKDDWFAEHGDDCVIVPMGELSLFECTKKSGIRKYRGSPLIGSNNECVIPTLQPWQVSERGEYLLRYAVASDLRKAKRYSKGYEAPTREFILPGN